MRKVVVIEGKLYPYNNMILPGALEPQDRPISVTYGSWSTGAIIGVATDFQRNEETGEISFEIEFDRRLPAPERDFYEKETEATVFVTPVEFEDTETARNVTKGVIRAVTLLPPSGANPAAFREALNGTR